MLTFSHFSNEYFRTCKLLGIKPDSEAIEIYYDTVADFSDETLSECFFEARISLKNFPTPAELREIKTRLSLKQSSNQKALPFKEVEGSPCPQYVKEMLAAFARRRSRFPKRLSEEHQEILDAERSYIFGKDSPYRPKVETKFVSKVEF
jgi:hypothetical protein